MKKNYIYLIASFLLTGCAQDAFEEKNLQETDVPQEIKLSAGRGGIEIEGRGAGSVGSTTGENNVWTGQELSIFCINKKAENFNTTDAKEGVFLCGVKATAPNAVASNVSTITFKDGSQYYPLQGAFNFFGYYIDDAADSEQPTVNEEEIIQSVTIDGTQDIMIADAALSLEDSVELVKSKYGEKWNEYIEVEKDENDKITALNNIVKDEDNIKAEWEKAFSSYTARRNIQPNLTFKHQLARLKFYIMAGDDNAVGGDDYEYNNEKYPTGILVNSIELINQRTKGIITITKDNITFAHDTEETELQTFKLRQQNSTTTGPLEDLVAIAPTKKDGYDPIGESIMAFPEDSYTINIQTAQYVKKVVKEENGNKVPGYEWLRPGGTPEETAYTNVKLTLKKDDQTVPFEAGKSYDIKIKVYSNQEISITATLTGWEHGGDIEINPGDEMFD